VAKPMRFIVIPCLRCVDSDLEIRPASRSPNNASCDCRARRLAYLLAVGPHPVESEVLVLNHQRSPACQEIQADRTQDGEIARSHAHRRAKFPKSHLQRPVWGPELLRFNARLLQHVSIFGYLGRHEITKLFRRARSRLKSLKFISCFDLG
jgi:hypothetical protein